MQTSGFFDAMELGNGQYDREYVAAQFAKYFSLFVGNGVFIQTANALQVVSAGDMNITMHAGAAFANGYWYLNDSDYTYTVPINTESTARYDSVVIAFDTVERTAEMRYKVNDISVVREDEIYELQIAQVVVNAGTIEITDAYIVDKRPDESVCGFVKGLVEVITTNELFNQFNEQFTEWFEVIKGQLSEDAAGNLQLQIDERVKKDDIVNLLNEIKKGTDAKKVTGIFAIKELIQEIDLLLEERVSINNILTQLSQVITTTDSKKVVGALAVKELNNNVIQLVKKIATGNNTYIQVQNDIDTADSDRHILYGWVNGQNPEIGYERNLEGETGINAMLKFYTDGTNVYAQFKKEGADTVTKKLGSEIIKVASGSGNATLSATSISGYEKLTASDFKLVPTKLTAKLHAYRPNDSDHIKDTTANFTPALTYTSSSGQIKVTGCQGSASWSGDGGSNGYAQATLAYDIYVFI